ncbi:MAG: hypothetical protein FJ291_22995 [Planctomycetes bacterium]|nr:hypothetical protein [Planctomycetota bacterium]
MARRYTAGVTKHLEAPQVMPSLNWIGKEAVVNHHRQVPYRLLTCDPELSAGDPHAGNLLVEGEACRLSPERLSREGIAFRQIPYEIKVT